MTFFPLISFRLPIVFHFTVPWKPGNLYVFGHLMYRKYIRLTNLFLPQRAVFVFSACCFHSFYFYFFRFLSLTVLMVMVEGKKITVGTRQPHVSYSVITVSRMLQEQKSSFQTLSTAALQLPFQLQEQPFWLTHQLEW